MAATIHEPTNSTSQQMFQALRSTAAICLALVCLNTSAQTLWGDARVGMSPAEVVAKYPEAVFRSDAEKADQRQEPELLRISKPGTGAGDTTILFFFRELRLYKVVVRSPKDTTFQETLPTFERIAKTLMELHPARGPVKKERQLARLNIEADEWETKEGVRVSISLYDSAQQAPVRIAWLVDGSSALIWLEMAEQAKAREAALAETLKTQAAADARNLEAAKTKKAAEGRRHIKFLESWLGKNVSELAKLWGAPNSTTKLPSQEVIYLWDSGQGAFTCRTSVFTRSEGLITHYQWKGTGCGMEAAQP